MNENKVHFNKLYYNKTLKNYFIEALKNKVHNY